MAAHHFSQYLFTSLRDQGVRYCFGIPGDYILPFFDAIEKIDGIDSIVATHEPAAAFSADAYARLNGLGVLLVTYGVGALNVMNGVACAYAESSPVLVISGAPSSRYSYHEGNPFSPMVHHTVKNPHSQIEAFGRLVEKCFRIKDKESAANTIQEAIRCAKNKKRPVYLEVSSDLMLQEIPVSGKKKRAVPSQGHEINNTLDYFRQRIQAAENPVLHLGVEISRYNLQGAVKKMMASLNIPAVLTPMGKGVIAEDFPGCYGVYAGVLSHSPEMREFVERSDLVISLGALVTDVNCGVFTADLKQDKMLIARTGWIGDGYANLLPAAPLAVFIEKLADHLAGVKKLPSVAPRNKGFDYASSDSIMDRFLHVINSHLNEHTLIIADTGDSCYGSLFLQTRRDNGFMAPLFYNSMGFAVPAAVGAQLAEPGVRPLVLVGDGAFQMTGLEISTMLRYQLDPIILIFNNNGYGMQRLFQDGPFNTLGRWNYSKVTSLVNGGKSWKVSSPDELAAALAQAGTIRNCPCIIEVIVPQGQVSTPLRIFSDAVKREKTGLCPLQITKNEPCSHFARCAYCRAAIWG